MNEINESKYEALITNIRNKRTYVILLTVLAVLLVLLFTTPASLEIMGKVIIDYDGLPPVVTIILILLCLFVEGIAYGFVSLPLSTSLDEECDPEKQLVLNKYLNKQKSIDHIYVVDHFYLGHYTEAIKLAEKMIKSPNEQMALVGLFNQARCEFFLGDYDSLHQTVAQYESKLSNCQSLKPKAKVIYQKINRILSLLCAVSNNDIEKTNDLRGKIENWNASKATEGFVNYIKGLSAYKAEDKEEAIYRFKSVMETCSKTVLGELSENYLSLLK